MKLKPLHTQNLISGTFLSPPQNFGLPSSKAKPIGPERFGMSEGSYGAPNVMTCG